MESRDETPDTLLDLDGRSLVLDEKGDYRVKFLVCHLMPGAWRLLRNVRTV